jgi:hypothetical protein
MATLAGTHDYYSVDLEKMLKFNIASRQAIFVLTYGNVGHIWPQYLLQYLYQARRIAMTIPNPMINPWNK